MALVTTPNLQCPQQVDDEHKASMNQQAVLKCPRCDSSNTKFCYYNNYSLSQPRHLCKSCKRYWTRGGTLRNVPVGGGCRKQKRLKRPTSTTTAPTGLDTTASSGTSSHKIDAASASPLFYDMNNSLGFPRFMNYDLDNNGYMNGFASSNNSALLSIFSTSSSSSSSLLGSTDLMQQQISLVNDAQGLLAPREQQPPPLQMGTLKGVKVEGGQKQMMESSASPWDPISNSNPLLYNWNDQPNFIAPASLTSLI